MNKLSEMQSFVSAVDSGSFADAARRMGIAKSVISQRIRQMEMRLHCILLERGRQLTLTEAGQTFYSQCVRILEDVARAEDSISLRSTQLTGNLRLSAPMVFSCGHLASIMAQFASLYPALNLDIEFDDRHLRLQEHDFDAAIRIGQVQDNTLISRTLAPNRHVICASPDYLSRHGTPRKPEDLVDHHAMLYLNREPHGMWTLAVNGELKSFRVRSRLRTDNGFQLLECAKAGMGLAILPTFLAATAIASGQLQVVLADHPPPGGHFSLVYRPSRRDSPKIKALATFLSQQISEPSPWDSMILDADRPLQEGSA